MLVRPCLGGPLPQVPYTGRSCYRVLRKKRSRPIAVSQRRTITQNYLRKIAEGEQAWKEQAERIRAGEQESMLSVLEKRGYINSIAGGRKELDRLMIEKRVGVYLGIDPTGPSLHVGHLVPLMSLFWMFVHGFHSVTLLGGSTAQIGDPTGRTTSRESEHSSVRKANIVSMHYQLKMLWANMEHHARFKHGYQEEWIWHRELVNNNFWMNKQPLLEFLKLLGSGVRLGTMLGRDTVKNKMENGDGMSFAEFSYPLVQAWDWWHMYNTKQIQLQIGGSDQYGNIIAGMDAVNNIRMTHYDPDIRQETDDPLMKAMGFTVPLLTTASGEKFGKSAGNAVWLSKDMTSTFDLFQFFLRCADADVGRYLRLLTFIPLPEIVQILHTHEQDPSKRTAQRRLAREVVEMVYGLPEAKSVEEQHAALFQTATSSPPTTTEDSTAISEVPKANNSYQYATSTTMPPANVILPRSLVYNQSIARVFYAAGLVTSRVEGHRLASNRGAYIGSRPAKRGGMGDGVSFTPIMNWKPEETEKFVIDNELLILRVGKWRIRIVKIVSDEEFEEKGLDAPGWQEWKEGKKEFKEETDERRAEELKAALVTESKKTLRAKRRVELADEETRTKYQKFREESLNAGKGGRAKTYLEFWRNEKLRNMGGQRPWDKSRLRYQGERSEKQPLIRKQKTGRASDDDDEGQ